MDLGTVILGVQLGGWMGMGVVCTTWYPGVCPPGVGWGFGGGGMGGGCWGWGVKNRKFSKSQIFFQWGWGLSVQLGPQGSVP